MTMDLRRFNQDGLSVFQEFLDSCTLDEPRLYPESALSDPGYSEPIDTAVSLELRTFGSRFDLAEYLHQKFIAAGFRPARADRLLWAWIACFYFREICPRKGTAWDPGASARWIPQSADWRRYYRHLIAGPYSIYRAHEDDPGRALALLCQKPGRPGDLVEQLASRQEIVTNKALLQFATDCYVDPNTRQQRRSASSKGKGGARRLVDVIKQFDVTWDLSAMSTVELRRLLPGEFRTREYFQNG